jgi:hypothetical protein
VTLSADDVSSYNTNAADSPLLRLPPEVGNQIWELLLCSTLINIRLGQDGSSIAHRVCAVAENYFGLAQRIKDLKVESETIPYGKHHRKCSSPPKLQAETWYSERVPSNSP